MTVVLIFLTVFVAVVTLLFAFSMRPTRETKQTMARLDAIRFGPQSPAENDADLIIRKQEKPLSSIEALDAFLRRIDLSARLTLLLYQAELSWTVGRLLLSSLVLGVAGSYLVFLRTGALFLSFVFLVVSGGAPFFYAYRRRGQRFERMKQHLPEALDLMVSAIRAGHSFGSAMGMAAREAAEPVKREFRQSFDEQNFGLELRVAMNNLVYRVPIKEVRMIATATLIQKETGGNLTEILEKTAHLIREDFRLQRQVRVHTAQGRITGWILALLPVILGTGLYLVNPDNMAILWTKPLGIHMLQGATVMTVIGTLIIRKIVRPKL
jgi:tight adherence protein B